MTPAMKAALRKVFRATYSTELWYRAESAGERVSLAYLHRNGYCQRRAWRGDGVSRDSAFEYRLSDDMTAAFDRRREVAA